MRQIVRYFILLVLSLLVTTIVLSLVFSRSLLSSLGPVNGLLARLDNIFSSSEDKKIEPRPEKTVRLIEGWTSRDMGQYFESQGIWQSEEFLEFVGFPQIDYNKEKDLPPLEDFSDDFSFLSDKPKNRGLEGYLYPDTYRIYATSSPRELVVKMLQNFDNQLTAKMRADIKKQGKTIYEIVTMASLLEKEAPINYKSGDNRDARIISGIFWNRIKIRLSVYSDIKSSMVSFRLFVSMVNILFLY